ncbi:MAG: GNAT family N-acetyltransferase [Halolamina sp.]
MPGPVVEAGDRLSLRTLEREDLDFVHRAFTNPEIRYPMGNPVRSGDAVESWFETLTDDDGDETHFVVCRDGDDAGSEAADGDDVDRLGAVSLSGLTWRRPELAYWLVPAFHGEGYGREAVALAVEFAFTTEPTPAVEAGAYAANDASRGLLESLGFVEEGRLRKQRFVDGQYRDSVMYGLLREEWDGEAEVGGTLG